jgi:hypothetical protein
MAEARKKPPSMSQITLLEKVFTYFAMSSGDALKYLLPSANTRKAMMKRLTANAGMASVNHNPMAKNKRNNTYTWDCVNPGSFIRKVIPTDINKESRNFINLVSLILLNSSIPAFFKD